VRPRTGCYPDEEFLGLLQSEQQGPPLPQELVRQGLPVPQGLPPLELPVLLGLELKELPMLVVALKVQLGPH
jgi:hypothetical protein